MRSIIIGIVIGCVVGIMFGATVIAPRLEIADGRPRGTTSAPAVNAPNKKTGRAIALKIPIAAPAVNRNQSTVHWRMASAYPASLPLMGELASRIGRNLWNVSGGGMELKFYEPGSLVPLDGMFDAVGSGAIDSAFGGVSFWADKAPALSLFSAIPFGPEPDEYLAWMYFGGGQKFLNEIYRPFNIHGIICGITPGKGSGWFRREFTGPKDLEGLKMNTTGLAAKVFGKLGVLTQNLENENIFIAFDNGTIEATEFSLPSIDLKLGFNDVASHYYFPGWQRPAEFQDLIINQQKWDSLSTSRQSQIKSVCGDNVRLGLVEGNALQYAALKELTAKGVKIHRWPDSILSALKVAWRDVQGEQSRADGDFKRIWRSLEDFRRNYSVWKELSRP